MLVVVANQSDQVAQALVARWASRTRAGLLTSADLSTSGWSFSPGTVGRARAVIGGQIIPVEAITGVLTRMPCVFEGELLQIVPADRAYVAGEMTAFLLAWLTSLNCRIVNRPTPLCLSGPAFRREQWIATAHHLGIPARPVERRSSLSSVLPAPPEDPASPLAAVTVIGKKCMGVVDTMLAKYARRLAAAAQVDVLTVHFSGPERGACLVDATLWPDLSVEGVEDALLDYLQEKHPGGES